MSLLRDSKGNLGIRYLEDIVIGHPTKSNSLISLERKALDEALLMWRFRCFNRYIKKLSSPAEMSAIRKNQQARHSTLLENL